MTTTQLAAWVMLAFGGLYSGAILIYAVDRVHVWRRMPVDQYVVDFRRSLYRADPLIPIGDVIAGPALDDQGGDLALAGGEVPGGHETPVRSAAGAVWMVMAYPPSMCGPVSGAARTSTQLPSAAWTRTWAVWSGSGVWARRVSMA